MSEEFVTKRVLRVSRRWLVGLTLIASLVITVPLATAIATSVADDLATDLGYAGCDGGNLRSGYELLNRSDGPERRELVLRTLPIIDCTRYVEDKVRVRVSAPVQRDYLTALDRDSVQPVIRDGEIERSVPLP